MMGLPIERLESCDPVSLSPEKFCVLLTFVSTVQLPAGILGRTCRNVYNFWSAFDSHLLCGIFKRLYFDGVANDRRG